MLKPGSLDRPALSSRPPLPILEGLDDVEILDAASDYIRDTMKRLFAGRPMTDAEDYGDAQLRELIRGIVFVNPPSAWVLERHVAFGIKLDHVGQSMTVTLEGITTHGRELVRQLLAKYANKESK